MARKKPPTEDSEVQRYLGVIAAYEREFKPWERRNEKILKRYRDENRDSKTNLQAKFNILWSNVQTLVPATFAKLPQPDVSRRFKDNDPVGRIAALILERCLEFEIQHYNDYRQSLKQSVHDRFLGGRGTVWARYEPHFRAGQQQPDDGVQVTEDTDEAPVDEQLDYECAPVDYVHWKDFGHNVARTWEEVTIVWRRVYMSEDAVTERFGDEIAQKIPYDATPEDLKRSGKYEQDGEKKQALVIEVWDKELGVVVWLSKAMKQEIDRRDDPLGLKEFFPCPRPLYATLTNDSLIPVPDFTLYQDQATALDILSDRIDGLSRMLQVKGVYDGSCGPEIARLFTEGENGTLIPIKNWQAFAEKQGLTGAMEVLDLTPIAKALETAALTMEQVKGQVYEITGISDIIRGQTEAQETATAQQIKGQYASLRLKSVQEEVALFATDCLRLKAQIICAKFAPQTIAAISAAEQLSPEDQQLLPQALQLLIGQERMADPEADTPNPLRSFRVEIAADTLLQLDEVQEKQDRMEMLTAFGAYLEKSAMVGAQSPQLVPLLVEVGKFALTSFKIGKAIEGTFDQYLDQLKQKAMQPQQPPPDPEMEKVKMQAQAEQARMQMEQAKAQQEAQLEQQRMAAEQQKGAAELQLTREKGAADIQVQREKAQLDAQLQREKLAADVELRRHEIQTNAVTGVMKQRGEMEMKHRQITQDGALRQQEQDTSAALEKEKGDKESEANTSMSKAMGEFAKAQTEIAAALEDLSKALSAPKRVTRGADGRASGIEVVR